MEEIVLVTGYTPTFEKENQLRKFLVFLKKYGKPIFLILHNVPSKDIINLVDYFYYDSYNPLIINYQSTEGFMFFYMNEHAPDKQTLVTQFNARTMTNHSLAALNMIWHGLFMVKNLGFKIVHQIEYDTHFDNYNEFIENKELLKEYDAISYWLGPKDSMIYAQFNSYNLDAYSFEELKYNKEKILTSMKKGNYGGMGENVVSELLIMNKNYLFKHHNELPQRGIKIDLSGAYNWNPQENSHVVPFVQDDDVYVFLWTLDCVDFHDFKIIINDSQYHHSKLSGSEWKYFYVSSLDELKTIEVFINNKMIYKYDFVNDIDKDVFKYKSFIKEKNEHFFERDEQGLFPLSRK